jgi:hypothetical protein
MPAAPFDNKFGVKEVKKRGLHKAFRIAVTHLLFKKSCR